MSSIYENGPSSFTDATMSYYTGSNKSYGGIVNTEVGSQTMYDARKATNKLSLLKQAVGTATFSAPFTSLNFVPLLDKNGAQIIIPLHSLVKSVEYSKTTAALATVTSLIAATSTSQTVTTTGYNGLGSNYVQLPTAYTYTYSQPTDTPTSLTTAASQANTNLNIIIESAVATGTTGLYIWVKATNAVTTGSDVARITINYFDSSSLNP